MYMLRQGVSVFYVHLLYNLFNMCILACNHDFMQCELQLDM